MRNKWRNEANKRMTDLMQHVLVVRRRVRRLHEQQVVGEVRALRRGFAPLRNIDAVLRVGPRRVRTAQREDERGTEARGARRKAVSLQPPRVVRCEALAHVRGARSDPRLE